MEKNLINNNQFLGVNKIVTINNNDWEKVKSGVIRLLNCVVALSSDILICFRYLLIIIKIVKFHAIIY